MFRIYIELFMFCNTGSSTPSCLIHVPGLISEPHCCLLECQPLASRQTKISAARVITALFKCCIQHSQRLGFEYIVRMGFIFASMWLMETRLLYNDQGSDRLRILLAILQLLFLERNGMVA